MASGDLSDIHLACRLTFSAEPQLFDGSCADVPGVSRWMMVASA
jgi:hypothetical protein